MSYHTNIRSQPSPAALLLGLGLLGIAFANALPAQTLQLWLPLTNTVAGTGDTLPTDTNGGGMNLSLTMYSNGVSPISLIGNAGSGIPFLNAGATALDFTSDRVSTQGSTQPGNGSGAGTGPVLQVLNSATLAANLGAAGVITNFIVTMWVDSVANTGTSNDPRLFVLSSGATVTDYNTTGDNMGMQVDGANAMYWSVGGNTVTGTLPSGNFPTDTWMFFAVTYDGAHLVMYYGTTNQTPVQIGSLALANQTVSLGAAASLDIGNSQAKSYDRAFNGWFSDIRFYNGVAGTAAQNLAFLQTVQAQQLPPAPALAVWSGAVNTNWNTTTANWILTPPGGAGDYADRDFVWFDDAAAQFMVNLPGTVMPGGVTFSNSVNRYTITGAGTIAGAGGLTVAGTGTVTLSTTNLYAGPTTISAGTLALSRGGTLGGGSLLTLGAGGTFDVSAAGSPYELAAGLNAGGTGVTVGATAANIVGAAGGVFDLNTQPVALTWGGASAGTDSTHPALLVSQGTLNFNGNPVTVIVPGTALNAGVYTLISAPAITGAPAAAPSLGGNGLVSGYAGALSVSGGSVLLTVTPPPIFPAVVTNLPASSVEGTLASLNGQVVSTGNQTPTVTLYYGPADGGTNAAGWSNSVVLGARAGSYSYSAAGLSTNTTYYYTSTATNSAGLVWAAPSQSFTTLTANPVAVPTLIQYLSGTDKDNTVPWQFSVSSGQNAGIATNLPVPSCWESYGFGTFSYTQSSSSLSTDNAETGYYTNVFAVPASWAGKEIFLVFEGALTDTSASINGQSVGPTFQGGFYEFQYDVTPYVVVGATTNVLTVAVRKFSANSSVEAAEEGNVDYWIFGGIDRPVYLAAKPAAYIDYVAANPLANGSITNTVYLGGISANYTVEAFVTDTNNVMLGGVFSNTVSAGASNVVLGASLPTPNPWSTESPTLYTLTVQLVNSQGAVVHTVTNQIGFRTVTFVPQQGFFINGKKVILRGICHHEEWPTAGRCSSDLQNSNDVALMKDMNFNAVRESHYPENKTFLQECDRQGLYVFEEMDSYQTQIDLTDGIIHVYHMIRRDVNDPCIIAWDNGNETSWNGSLGNLDGGNSGSTNYYDLYDVQQRMVIHPGADGGVFMNLDDYHYPSYSSFTGNLGAGKTAYSATEIIHALYDGGGGAGLQDYWDAERVAPNAVGMFVWSWDDEGIIRTDEGGIMDVRDSHGPDGIVGPYREKEASYYSYKAIYSPVQMGAPNPAGFTGTLALTNRFDFTDLNQCTFDWQLGWYPDANDPAATFNTSTNALTGGLLQPVLDSGSFTVPSLPPGSGIGTPGLLTLPSFPANWTNYDALRLTAADPYGRNLYTWTWPLHSQAQITARIQGVVPASAPAITAGTNAAEIIVTNGPRVFHFSAATGLLDSLTVSNAPVSFTNGPLPVAGPAWVVTTITNYSDGTNYYVGVNNLAGPTNAFLWTLRPDGWLKLDYQFGLTGVQNFIGITFNYPTNQVTAMNWLGQGPYRVWKNRTAGQEIFTHTKSYNFPWTGQSTNYGINYGKPTTQWTYPEFEGYHGQLYWATLQTTEQPITVVTPATNLFFRIFTPPATDQPDDYRDAAFPPGQISLLQGIPPMGSKLNFAGSLGPSGQTNVATGLYTGEVNFFFGPPPVSDADRDGNGLMDAWELQYFGALGQNPLSRNDPDGLPLMVENALGFSPTNNNLNSPFLPHFAHGTNAPVALVYGVPVTEAGFFNYIPQISADLSTWAGADQHPEYFNISGSPNGATTLYTVQPVPAAWPGDHSHLFLRLEITPKP